VITAEFATPLDKGQIPLRNAMIEMTLSLAGCLADLRKRNPAAAAERA
jgi:hypothetical protein